MYYLHILVPASTFILQFMKWPLAGMASWRPEVSWFNAAARSVLMLVQGRISQVLMLVHRQDFHRSAWSLPYKLGSWGVSRLFMPMSLASPTKIATWWYWKTGDARRETWGHNPVTIIDKALCLLWFWNSVSHWNQLRRKNACQSASLLLEWFEWFVAPT